MTEDVNIKMTVDAGQSIQATNNYKKTLKELKDQMVQLQIETNGLADATAEQRHQYAELEQQAGAITDALGDVSAQIRANADDYQMFNAALEGLKGGAAVAQGLVGTLDMLGISNSGVEQVVKTLMSLQGVMNSINAVQQIFNKDSKVRIALQKLLTTTTKQTAVADAQATAATGALAAGEGVATTTSFTLVGALKAVSAAIMSIPLIGWILAAIAALTTLISLIVAANKEESEGERLQREREANQQAINEAYAEGEKAVAKERRELENNLTTLANCKEGTDEWNEAASSVAKTLGVGVEWIKKNKDKVNELAQAWMNVKKVQAIQDKLLENMANNDVKMLQLDIARSEMMNANYKSRRETVEKWAEVFNWSEDQIDDMVQAINDTRTTNEKDYRDAVGRMDSILNQSKNSISSAISTYQKEYDKLAASIAADQQTIKDATKESEKVENDLAEASKKAGKAKKDQSKESAKAAKDEGDRLKELTKANQDAAKQVAGYWKTYNNSIEDENSKTYEGRLDNLGREYAKTIDTLDKELEAYTKYYNDLTEEDKKALGDQLVTLEAFTAAQNQARTKALEKYTKAVEDENKAETRESVDRENQVDSEILNARLANLKEGTDLYYETKRELEEEQHEQDMEDLRRRLEDGQLTQEEYDQLAEEAERQHQQNLTNIQAEQDAARLELTQNRLETVGQMLQMASNFTQSLMDAELAAAGEDEKKQKEIKKKYAVANAMMQIGQIGVQTALGAISAFQAMSGIPVVGPALGAVAAALVTATGIAQMVKAGQEANKIRQAARGAYVVGPSHSEGGVNYELEGGEVVLNKKAMAIPQYRALASAMNVSTGGVAFPGAGNAAPLQASMDQGTVKSIVKETVAAVTAIPVVVSEESISKTQRKVSVLEGQSRLG